MATLHPVIRHAYRGARGRHVRTATAFLPYFSMQQTFEPSRATQQRPPALSSYFDRLLEFAVEAEWGRRPISRDAARARVAAPDLPVVAAPR